MTASSACLQRDISPVVFQSNHIVMANEHMIRERLILQLGSGVDTLTENKTKNQKLKISRDATKQVSMYIVILLAAKEEVVAYNHLAGRDPKFCCNKVKNDCKYLIHLHLLTNS